MATTRNNSALAAKNSRAVRNFTSAVTGTMVSFSRSTIQQAAKIGLQHMVHEAGFNDYTGKMINSYQAAILTKGGLEERVSRRFHIPIGEVSIPNKISGLSGGRTPILLTSHDLKDKGLVKISDIRHKQRKGVTRSGKPMKGFPMQTRRDGGESPEIRRSHSINGRKEVEFREGFGSYITRIKSIAPPIAQGYWLVFDNGASNVRAGGTNLADLVENQGQVRHRVFPKGIGVNLFGIGQQELKRSIAAHKRYFKK